MKLAQLLDGMDYRAENISPDKEIESITQNTDKCAENSIFCAVSGTKREGHLYVTKAINKGACLAVIDFKKSFLIPKHIPRIEVDDTRLAYAILCNRLSGEPIKRLKSVAVTGTNGKTTTAGLINSVLCRICHRSCLVGTPGIVYDNKTYQTGMTTPDAEILFPELKRVYEQGGEYLVTEASSIALDQHRFADCIFDVGIFTNLSQDHLDYHGNIENYFLAKSRLFDKCKIGLINKDDLYGKRLCNSDKSILSYGIFDKDTDFYAENIKYKTNETEFTLVYKSKRIPIHTPMIGQYSVYNALASAAACILLGVDDADITKEISQFTGMKGRAEKLQTDTDFDIYIDFAHTPDALKNILSALKLRNPNGRLIALFGAGGCRDKQKRPLMGKTVSEIADRVIITSDNSRDEDALDIINDIKKGIRNYEKVKIIVDRSDAVRYALSIAKANDTVVLCGKGDENYETDKTGKHRFSEKEIVFDYLK